MSRNLPPRPNLEHLKSQAKVLLRALEEGSSDALERYRACASIPLSSPPRLSDAQFVIAREYGFASWPKLKVHVESVVPGFQPVQALVAAVMRDDTDDVKELLDRFPELKTRLNDPLPGLPFDSTVLLTAAGHQNREMVDLLIRAGADINQRSHWWAGGFGVLDNADPKFVPFLIERGAVLDAHAAAQLGLLDELKSMVQRNPEVVHARGGDGHTPLHVASTLEVAEYLVDQGADLDARDIDHESTPAQYLVRDHQDVVRMLVARGCRTDILMAAALGDLALVRGHLENDPQAVRITVSERDFPKRNPKSGGTIYIWTLGNNKSPQVVAREFGHEAVFQLLLQHTPDGLKLALACELGDETLFRQLLTARPSLVGSLTPAELRKLPDAARDKNQKAVGLMLAAGWPINAKGDHGGTALHWSAWHGHNGMLREILGYRPNLELRDDDHAASPLGWLIHGSLHSWSCRTGDYATAARTLLDAGAQLPELPPDAEMSDAVRQVLTGRSSA